MKYNLNAGEHLVDIKFISFLFVICYIGTIVFTVFSFWIEMGYVFLFEIACYVLLCAHLYHISKNQEKENLVYLEVLSDRFRITDNIWHNAYEIEFSCIKRLYYDRFFSGVAQSFGSSKTMGNSLSIAYLEDDEEVEKFIGYMRIEDVKKIAEENNLNFEVR